MARKSTNNPRPKRRRGMELRRGRPKPCAFCKEKVDYVDWKDVSVLRKYMSDRGKIRGRRVNGNCPAHQRAVANAIKNAREMALLPYLSTR
jgi:small subunit ribosomal protein S18